MTVGKVKLRGAAIGGSVWLSLKTFTFRLQNILKPGKNSHPLWPKAIENSVKILKNI